MPLVPPRATQNLVLGELSPPELARLAPYLETMSLEPGEALFQAGEILPYVYFPETAVISLIKDMDGGRVEAATIGYDGIAGLCAFFNDDVSPHSAFTQIPGLVQRMRVADFTRLVAAPTFHLAALRYTGQLLVQMGQMAACNSLHLLVERSARWLLMTHDRAQRDEFFLRHEELASMLGVRRAGVTIVMRKLQDCGAIRYRRGRVAISDRAALERASCECYKALPALSTKLASDAA